MINAYFSANCSLTMENKWEEIFNYLLKGSYPAELNKGQKQSLRKYSSKFRIHGQYLHQNKLYKLYKLYFFIKPGAIKTAYPSQALVCCFDKVCYIDRPCYKTQLPVCYSDKVCYIDRTPARGIGGIGKC